MTTSTTTHTTPSWLGMRTIGPALMVVFGLVLLLGPLSSVGAQGSVGNAGNVPCPGFTSGGAGAVIPDDCPTPPCPGGNAGNAAFVAPDDCPEPTVPSTQAPTTQAPTTQAPTTQAPAPDPAPGGGATIGGEVTIGGAAPEPEVLGETATVDQPGAAEPTAPAPEVLGSTDERTGAAPATTELAFTGPQDSSIVASVAGAILVLTGGTLLVLSRRRTA